MSSLTSEFLLQERHSKRRTGDAALGAEAKGQRPRFLRLARALEEARLDEGRSEETQHRTPRFQRLEKALAMRQIEADFGLHPAGIDQAADEGAKPRLGWLRLPAACSLGVVAGAAVAVAGGALMAQWAATSPVESREPSAPHVPLSEPPAIEEILLPPLGMRLDLRPRVVGEIGGRTLDGAGENVSFGLYDRLARLSSGDHRPDSLDVIAAIAQNFTLLVQESDDVDERRSVAATTGGVAAIERPPPDPTAVMEDGESSSYDDSSYLSAYDHGYALQGQGRYLEALASYQVAIERKPATPHALYNMGAVLSKLGRLEEAASAFEKAATLDQSNPFVYYDWGWTLEQAGAVDMAIEKYQLAVATDARSTAAVHAHKRLGVLQR
jgi:tetratricopeptide (TPR) repeat protein